MVNNVMMSEQKMWADFMSETMLTQQGFVTQCQNLSVECGAISFLAQINNLLTRSLRTWPNSNSRRSSNTLTHTKTKETRTQTCTQTQNKGWIERWRIILCNRFTPLSMREGNIHVTISTTKQRATRLAMLH